MSLSSDLISKFVKVTKPSSEATKSTTVYGTVVTYNDTQYVRLDGSDLLTPFETTVDVQFGERVSVVIEDHTATVTGSITDPSASSSSIRDIGSKISEFEIIIAGKVDTVELVAVNGRIDNLEADNVTIKGTLLANDASIEELFANEVVINESLTAHQASIEDLQANKLSATDATLKYANIDFTNIGQAAMEYFYATSGLIQNVTVGDATITGELVGVTIKGDLIEGGTIVADKLVIQGEDGLYYKLNTNGMTVEAEQTEYNSLSGTIITAKSITAEKISVSDLVAFGATIGGFTISDASIYSGVKESINNTTRGIFLGKDGQIAFGDASNFVKYYKDEDDNYKLAISADSLTFTSSENGIISTINQSPETIKIDASKIELEGAVTFSSLDSDTQTLINAGSNAGTAAEAAQTAAEAAQTAADSALARTTNQYGTCSTSASTAAKVVTLSGFELYTGATISVKFTYANAAASATLNVNGTGAKNIYAYNAVLAQPYYWSAGAVLSFTYDGSYWRMISNSTDDAIKNWCYNNDKTYINGGKIYANSVTATQIDVSNLFAQNITATGNIQFSNDMYSITGDSSSGDVTIQSYYKGYLRLDSNWGLYLNSDSGYIYIKAFTAINMITGITDGVYINDNTVIHEGNISSYLPSPTTKTASATVTVATGTSSYTTIASVSLTAGTWIVNAGIGAYMSGTLIGCIFSGSSGEYTSRASGTNSSSASNYINCSTTVTLTSTTTVYIKACHNYGSSLSVGGYIKATSI